MDEKRTEDLLSSSRRVLDEQAGETPSVGSHLQCPSTVEGTDASVQHPLVGDGTLLVPVLCADMLATPLIVSLTILIGRVARTGATVDSKSKRT